MECDCTVKTFISFYRTPGPQKVLKGFWRVFWGISEGVSEGVLKGRVGSLYLSQPKGPSQHPQNAFKSPSKAFHEGVEIDDALGFPGLKNQFHNPGVL